jgi:hypothetical protein
VLPVLQLSCLVALSCSWSSSLRQPRLGLPCGNARAGFAPCARLAALGPPDLR